MVNTEGNHVLEGCSKDNMPVSDDVLFGILSIEPVERISHGFALSVIFYF